MRKRLHREGDEALVGETLLEIETNNPLGIISNNAPPDNATNVVAMNDLTKKETKHDLDDDVSAVPTVRKYAREKGIPTLSLIKPSGRVTMEDIDNYLATKNTKLEAEIVRLTPFQKSMSELMSKAALVPHLGLCDEYVVGEKRMLLARFIYHLSRSLHGTNLNATYEGGDFLTKQPHVNVGIAVDTPHGLVVPNILKAEELEIEEIDECIRRLAKRAKENRLSREELRDGTVTVSNVGAIGGGFARPVLVVPQVLIVALGQVRDGVLPVSWAADHRVIDGASIARLSQGLREKFNKMNE